ncbi:lanthionine synthetase C family protein [Nonomuraea sp. NPDC048916]|uniref:lanthionine synthetase C family protein n=1 Tax=Nonomuraea sp. NPDC048916 TaxID=3154232 RepID=UPI00340B12FB
MNPPTTQALAEGALGVALLHIERDDLAAARPFLTEAVAGGVSTGANACLFHGAPALEFVLSRAGRVDREVQAAVDRVVAARLAAASRRRESARLPHLAEFDLIRGLTGLGVLLLTRAGTSLLTEQVLAYLVSLARPVCSDGRELPGWWSQAGPGHEIAGGHGNNGVAHGIAGPLALLSIASRRGIEVAGQADAIGVLARWLNRFGGFYWITHDQLSAAETPQASLARRPSWCYGDLGIARALQLAAIALGDSARRQAAEDIAMAALTDPARIGRITDASLCHGWAGLLTVTRAIAADSSTSGRFTACLEQLSGRLSAGIGALSKPGFMEGRAGAHLALDGTNATGWTRTLLID